MLRASFLLVSSTSHRCSGGGGLSPNESLNHASARALYALYRGTVVDVATTRKKFFIRVRFSIQKELSSNFSFFFFFSLVFLFHHRRYVEQNIFAKGFRSRGRFYCRRIRHELEAWNCYSFVYYLYFYFVRF